MIFGFNRRRVINNIKKNAEKKQFNAKAELNDPVLTKEEVKKLVQQFWQHTQTLNYRILNLIFRRIFGLVAIVLLLEVGLKGCKICPILLQLLSLVITTTNSMC